MCLIEALVSQSQEHSCIHSVALVVDEDVSRQLTLTREGEVVIGASMAVNLPYSDGKDRFSVLHRYWAALIENVSYTLVKVDATFNLLQMKTRL